MINQALEKDIKDLVFEDKSLLIKKGTVGGFSIEVESETYISFDSYIYKNESDRDKDFEILWKN